MRLNYHKGNFWQNGSTNTEAKHDGNTFPSNPYYSKKNNYNQTANKYWPSPLIPDNNRWFVDRDNFPNENLSSCYFIVVTSEIGCSSRRSF